MRVMTRFCFCVGIGLASAALCMFSVSAFAQDTNAPHAAQAPGKAPGPIVGGFDKVKVLQPGGPAPRNSDGHPDLTGRWYPNPSGRMLQFAYPLEEATIRQFDPKVTPEERISIKPGIDKRYTKPVPYGECDQAGTPSAALEQISQHAPMELISQPGKLWMLFEYPMDIRLIHTDGRAHLKDPDPSFNGDSVAHWEGDTLVIDVIGIDQRMRVITGAGSGFWPSDKFHVIERINRTSKNLLTYQVTIEDPVVLTKPWKSAPRVWSLAQDPKNDYWTEVFCTLNEEPSEIRKINAAAPPSTGRGKGR